MQDNSVRAPIIRTVLLSSPNTIIIYQQLIMRCASRLCVGVVPEEVHTRERLELAKGLASLSAARPLPTLFSGVVLTLPAASSTSRRYCEIMYTLRAF